MIPIVTTYARCHQFTFNCRVKFYRNSQAFCCHIDTRHRRRRHQTDQWPVENSYKSQIKGHMQAAKIEATFHKSILLYFYNSAMLFFFSMAFDHCSLNDYLLTYLLTYSLHCIALMFKFEFKFPLRLSFSFIMLDWICILCKQTEWVTNVCIGYI